MGKPLVFPRLEMQMRLKPRSHSFKYKYCFDVACIVVLADII